MFWNCPVSDVNHSASGDLLRLFFVECQKTHFEITFDFRWQEIVTWHTLYVQWAFYTLCSCTVCCRFPFSPPIGFCQLFVKQTGMLYMTCFVSVSVQIKKGGISNRVHLFAEQFPFFFVLFGLTQFECSKFPKLAKRSGKSTDVCKLETSYFSSASICCKSGWVRLLTRCYKRMFTNQQSTCATQVAFTNTAKLV